MNEKQGYSYRSIDPLLHSPIRLAIMSLLMNYEEVEFTFIRDEIGATDGNLNSHLAKLEDQAYIEVRKTFQGKKPVTYQRLTEKGREAFEDYVNNLEKFLVPKKGDKQ